MTLLVADPDFTLHLGDVRELLAELPDESVHCVVTSPPYWGLRDYGTGLWEGGNPDCDHIQPTRKRIEGCVGCGCPMNDCTPGCDNCAARFRMRTRAGLTEDVPDPSYPHHRSRERDTEIAYKPSLECGKCGARRVDQQLGLEPTPDQYIQNMVGVFREVRRVLRRDGTLWLNIGDSYNSSLSNQNGQTSAIFEGRDLSGWETVGRQKRNVPGLKPKDLCGIPWRLAFALQADGWYLRAEIIWAKPNPMPESVTDRPTKAHEQVFLLTRSPRYFYDADAVREPHHHPSRAVMSTANAAWQPRADKDPEVRRTLPSKPDLYNAAGRNLRSVWEIPTEPFPQAHFATYPQALVERCLKAGCPEGGTVFDPFIGSGTTALVARRLGRKSIGIELSPEYAQICLDRTRQLSLLAT
jgi:DNA modification methylase